MRVTVSTKHTLEHKASQKEYLSLENYDKNYSPVSFSYFKSPTKLLKRKITFLEWDYYVLRES